MGSDSNVRLVMAAVSKAMDEMERLHPRPGSSGRFKTNEDYKRTWNRLYYAHQELVELLNELGPGTPSNSDDPEVE